jgi:outer membrane protein OmpA-like peptidoglycan-associated protein
MAKKLLPVLLGIALSIPVADISFAAAPQESPSKDDIINALISKDSSTSRGIRPIGSPAPATTASDAAKPAVRTTYNSSVTAAAGAKSAHASIGVPILFDVNSATIKPASESTLAEIAAALRSPNLKGVKILLEGHTDASGRPDTNLELSQQRADAVRDYLVGKGGVSGDQLTTIGKGQAEPANPNDPLGPENRRVVLVNLDN